MFVGVGASRVRDLFDQAKRNSPVHRLRRRDRRGRPPARRRPRRLARRARADPQPDPRRDGRLRHEHQRDRRRRHQPARRPRPGAAAPGPLRPPGHPRPPGHEGPRPRSCKVHTKGKPLDKGVDVEGVARQSPGFSGADLANLVNEAAILSARRNKKVIGMSEFQEALERIIAGPERKSPGHLGRGEGDHRLPRGRSRRRPADPAQVRPGQQGHDHQPRHGPRLHDGPAPGGPLPPVQDRVRGQDRGPARRQRRGADDLRRHDDRRQQRHREGDRPRAPDGHRVRHERQARPALLREARRAGLPRPRDRRAAQLLATRSPSRSTKRSGRSSTRPTSGRRRSSRPTATGWWPWPRSSSPRRRSTPRGSRRCSPTCRPRTTVDGIPAVIGPGQPIARAEPAAGLIRLPTPRPRTRAGRTTGPLVTIPAAPLALRRCLTEPPRPPPWTSTSTQTARTRASRATRSSCASRASRRCPSTPPTSAGAAEWLADALRATGLEHVEVAETGGHPIVYADWLHAEGAPTVLVYGHYDVQPVDPLDLWTSPPFEPVVDDGRMLARGAADDKGQIHAPRCWRPRRSSRPAARCPVNVKFVFEGEEESSSDPPRRVARRANRTGSAADVAIISDTGFFEGNMPAITVGLRGLMYAQIDVVGLAGRPPLGRLRRRGPEPGQSRWPRSSPRSRAPTAGSGSPASTTRSCALTDAERAAIAALPFDEEAYREALGVPALVGEVGYSTLERRGARPTLDVNGIWGGFQGEGAKTIIPAHAHAKVSCRLVRRPGPGRHLRASSEPTSRRSRRPASRSRSRTSAAGGPSLTPIDHPVTQAAARALEATFGRAPRLHPRGRLDPGRGQLRVDPRPAGRAARLRPAGRQRPRPQRVDGPRRTTRARIRAIVRDLGRARRDRRRRSAGRRPVRVGDSGHAPVLPLRSAASSGYDAAHASREDPTA